jgi:hypothetical protein
MGLPNLHQNPNKIVSNQCEKASLKPLRFAYDGGVVWFGVVCSGLGWGLVHGRVVLVGGLGWVGTAVMDI